MIAGNIDIGLFKNEIGKDKIRIKLLIRIGLFLVAFFLLPIRNLCG